MLLWWVFFFFLIFNFIFLLERRVNVILIFILIHTSYFHLRRKRLSSLYYSTRRLCLEIKMHSRRSSVRRPRR